MATADKAKSKSTPEVVDSGAGTKAGEQIGGTPAKGVAAPEGGATPEATEPAKQPEKSSSSQPEPDTSGDAGNDQQAATAKDGAAVSGDSAETSADESTAVAGQPEPSVNQPDVAVEQFITRTREAPILPSK